MPCHTAVTVGSHPWFTSLNKLNRTQDHDRRACLHITKYSDAPFSFFWMKRNLSCLVFLLIAFYLPVSLAQELLYVLHSSPIHHHCSHLRNFPVHTHQEYSYNLTHHHHHHHNLGFAFECRHLWSRHYLSNWDRWSCALINCTTTVKLIKVHD